MVRRLEPGIRPPTSPVSQGSVAAPQHFLLSAGALVGSIVGLTGIPSRFVEGLTKGEELRALALALAEQAFPEAAGGRGAGTIEA